MAPPLADLDRWTAWGAAYGSYSRADGDGVVGSQRPHRPHRPCRRRVRASHLARCGGRLRAVGRQRANFRLSDGLGSGRGDILQGGFYGAWRFDSYYLVGARSPPRITTCRATASCRCRSPASSPRPTARPASARRIEGGRRFVQAGFGVTPFVAVQAQHRAHRRLQRASSSADRRSPRSSYDAETTSRLRTEVGATFDRRFGEVMGRHAATGIRASPGCTNSGATIRSSRRSSRCRARASPSQGAAPFTNAALLAAGAQLAFRQRADLARQDRGRVRRPRHHLQRQRGAAESLVVSGSRRKIRPPSRWRPYPFPDRDRLAADCPLPDHDRSVGPDGARGHFTASMAMTRMRPVSGMARMHMDADTAFACMHVHLRGCRRGKRDR